MLVERRLQGLSPKIVLAQNGVVRVKALALVPPFLLPQNRAQQREDAQQRDERRKNSC
jgi:hypothetical protein